MYTRHSFFLPLCLLVLSEAQLASAVKFPFHVHHSDNIPRLQRRAGLSGQTTGNTTVPVANSNNAIYISNITLGGQSVPVSLDTGSSDLWVASSIPNAQDSGKSASLSYAVGQVSGNINTADLNFDNYTVSNQAFLLVTNTSSFTTNMASQPYRGLVGLGPNSASVISRTLNKGSAGDSMMNRIFQLNTTSNNFISFLLNRRSDPNELFTGQLTISEFVPGYENIGNAPKLAVEKVLKVTNEDQHFQIRTDPNNGIIGPDGNPINSESIVPEAPSGTLVAVIDSGFTFSQVPRAVSDAIYGRVRGAVYNTTNQIWTIPCDQLLNISFNFGGNNFPIHPLDTSSSDFDATGANGQQVCLGTFQPITSAFSLLGEFDMILGTSFLRNAYTLIDFGNFVDATSNDQGNPYIQLLSVTNVNDAHSDFVQVRLNGVDTTGDPSQSLLPTDQMQHSPESDSEKSLHASAVVLSRWPYIVAGCLAFLAITVGYCLWKCCCRRKVKKPNPPSFIPMSGGQVRPTYYPLQDQGSRSPGGHHPGLRR